MELSADDKAGMTPEEIAALTSDDAAANLARTGEGELDAAAAGTADADAAAAAAAEKPAEGAEGAAAGAEGAEGAEGAAGELTAEQIAELAAAEGITADEPETTTAPTNFRVDTRDFKADRAALRSQVDAIDAKWGVGEMTDAERKVALEPLQDAMDALTRAQVRAETLSEINEQTAVQTLSAAVVDVLNQARKDGTIDYKKDQKAAKQFDGFWNALLEDPDNAGQNAAWFATEAHKSMLALRGIKAAAPPPPPPPPAGAPAAPAAAARRNVPTTLSGIPAASPTGMEQDALDKFAQLEGEDAEDYLASLPKAEQDRIMRAADAGSMQFQRAPRSRASRDSRAVHSERVE